MLYGQIEKPVTPHSLVDVHWVDPLLCLLAGDEHLGSRFFSFQERKTHITLFRQKKEKETKNGRPSFKQSFQVLENLFLYSRGCHRVFSCGGVVEVAVGTQVILNIEQ